MLVMEPPRASWYAHGSPAQLYWTAPPQAEAQVTAPMATHPSPPPSIPPSTATPPALPRAAASVVLLRDAPGAGLQVLLLRRHGRAAVLGGAHVFPGGKVDAADAALDAPQHLDQTPATLHASLGEPALDEPAACALYVAAAREVFEECGVLMVHGTPRLQPDDAAGPFNGMLARHGLRLATRDMAPWSRWITPVASTMNNMANSRFDTRFFVAVLPAGQTALHDGHENTESAWLGPREALQRYWDGAITLAPPQIMSLAHLSRHADTASVLHAARQQRPPVIQPEPIQIDGLRAVCYPGDASHPVRERALPGPTRLVWRNERFEPVDGLAALLG
jgi:8-oxo-dGTP pyrophosphatase MutT (NUDIX family)